ncbi:MAG TPA: hypothetical protein VJR89_28345 [Polyangiales bacterium]|nr:hypothetical protein [Polyangiales bacterium]
MAPRVFQREFWESDTPAADLARAVAFYVVTRLAFAVFVWLTGQHFDCGRAGCLNRGFFPNNFLLNGLFQWDAQQYRQVIEKGYYLGVGFDTTAPFFPMFPLLAWAVGKLIGSALWGGILLNNLCSIAAGFGITRLCRRLGVGEQGGPREAIARETTLFWMASPLTWFFSVFQSEAVFGALSVGVLWGVVAGLPWWTLVCGVLITATRNSGIVVVACAFLLAFERRRELRVTWFTWLGLALAPLGLAGFILYQYVKLGDGFAWVATQIRWNRFLTTPWRTISDEWVGWPPVSRHDVAPMYRTQELLALALMLPLFLLRRRLNIPWALLALGIVEWLLPLMSHQLFSAARYQAGNIYFALAIPALLANRPLVRGLCWMFFGMVLAWYLSTYPHGVWST